MQLNLLMKPSRYSSLSKRRPFFFRTNFDFNPQAQSFTPHPNMTILMYYHLPLSSAVCMTDLPGFFVGMVKVFYAASATCTTAGWRPRSRFMVRR